MPKQNILVVTELFPNRQKSFLGTFVVDQLKLLQNYYNIFVITPFSQSFFERIKSPHPSFAKLNGINVYYINYVPLWLLGLRILRLVSNENYIYFKKRLLGKRINKLATKLNKEAQFSLVHGHEVFVGDEVIPIARKLKIPSIITIHGLYDYHLSSFGKRTMSSIIANLNQATSLITVSNIAKESYTAQGVTKRVTVIPNGINIQSAKSLPSYWQNIVANKKVLLAVGFFAPEKNFDLLIRACHDIKKKLGNTFVLLIIGEGDQKDLYLSLIRKLNLSEQVFVVGQIPPSEISAFFNACDVLVHPSIIESFSMVCLEAMSQHKPFICTTNTGITEHISNGKEAFIIQPNNYQQLYDRTKSLLENDTLRKKMGNLAHQTALRLNWGYAVEKIKEQYNNCTGHE